MMSASFSTATFLIWPNSCLATSRLFAVAQIRRDGCVRAVSLLRRSPEPCLKQKVFQAEGVLHRRALDFFLDFHTLGFKGALVVSDELACTR